MTSLETMTGLVVLSLLVLGELAILWASVYALTQTRTLLRGLRQ